jgi:hypothetical protein
VLSTGSAPANAARPGHPATVDQNTGVTTVQAQRCEHLQARLPEVLAVIEKNLKLRLELALHHNRRIAQGLRIDQRNTHRQRAQLVALGPLGQIRLQALALAALPKSQIHKQRQAQHDTKGRQQLELKLTQGHVGEIKSIMRRLNRERPQCWQKS